MDIIELLRPYSVVEPVDDELVEQVLFSLPTEVPRRTRRRRSRVLVGAGAVVVFVGVGSGIAAASGWWNNPTFLLPAQVAFSKSPDPSALPGVTVGITTPGPDGVTFKVFDASFSYQGVSESCSGLWAYVGTRPFPPSQGSACSIDFPVGPTHSIPPSVSWSEQSWSAPSGAQYRLVWGTALPGTVSVRLTDDQGNVLASEPANPGGYVVYVPATDLTSEDRISFYNSAGAVVFTSPLRPVGTITTPPPS